MASAHFLRVRVILLEVFMGQLLWCRWLLRRVWLELGLTSVCTGTGVGRSDWLARRSSRLGGSRGGNVVGLAGEDIVVVVCDSRVITVVMNSCRPSRWRHRCCRGLSPMVLHLRRRRSGRRLRIRIQGLTPRWHEALGRRDGVIQGNARVAISQ